MGVYLNPGNEGFSAICKGTYIDKTGMLGVMNKTIGTTRKLTFISRPRRFGKSYAAKMLCAYYDKTCDSHALFDDLKIATDERYSATYLEHLNQYDVIYLDMTNIMGKASGEDIVPFIQRSVTAELVERYPDVKMGHSFDETLLNTTLYTGNKFIAIIDEWDALIRDSRTDFSVQKNYLDFLRMLFKGSGTTDRIFDGVYMTGILPIKKEGSQSALSDFTEYTMLYPDEYQEFVGFTEEEVRDLCEKNQMDFEETKRWYDGYYFPQVGSIYNPFSIMEVMRTKNYRSYWCKTSASESLLKYVSMDYQGLAKAVAELIGGIRIKIDPDGFDNDLVSFRSKDDVLTLLIHFGYLAYDEASSTVRIPNEEIRVEFARTIREVEHSETIQRVQDSDQLIENTIHMNEQAVAAQIEKVHDDETTSLFYNNEQALRSVIKLAYFSYRDHFLKFEELPSGKGYADLVYYPKKDSAYPVLVIELKWNQTEDGAIAQIKEKKYPSVLEGYGGDILLVGVNYDTDTKKHTCKIEKVEIR